MLERCSPVHLAESRVHGLFHPACAELLGRFSQLFEVDFHRCLAVRHARTIGRQSPILDPLEVRVFEAEWRLRWDFAVDDRAAVDPVLLPGQPPQPALYAACYELVRGVVDPVDEYDSRVRAAR